MGKILLIAVLTLAVVSSQLTPAQNDIQLALNGVFTENKLANPTTIVQCIDPTTAQNIINFANKILPQFASASLTDLPGLIKQCQAFGDTIPSTVGDCLNNNAEITQIEGAYGINDKTNWAALGAQVMTYLTFHWGSVHKGLQGVNTAWQAANYYQAGYNVAVLAHQILGQPTLSLLSQTNDQEILQEFFNGLFAQNNLAAPTTLVQCYDPATAQSMVNFIGTILPKAASVSVFGLAGLVSQIQSFVNSIPAPVQECVKNNPENTAILAAYGIQPGASPLAYIDKAVSYITLHFSAFKTTIGQINDQWQSGNYYQAGFQAGAFGHSVLGATEEQMILTQQTPAQQTLQQFFNGAFAENNLAAPTTLVQCYDGDSAQSVVNFINTLLPKLQSATVFQMAGLAVQIQDFIKSLPPSVQTCVAANPENIALMAAYGIAPGADVTQYIDKVLSYITFHWSEFKTQVGNINTAWQAGKYYDAGYQLAAFGHAVLGKNEILEKITEAFNRIN